MLNPFAAFPITEGWQGHLDRGSAGGIDWGTPVGTPVYASEAGALRFIPNNGTGGNTATLIRDPNHSTQFMHLSSFVGPERNVAEGELIGRTGGAVGSPGAGSSTGPHCHAHSYDYGTRVPPFFLNATAGLPGSINPEVTAMAINLGLFKYVDTVNPDRWFLTGPVGNVEVPGDGTENQLARLTQGQVVDLGPNGLVALGKMQQLELDARRAVVTGGAVTTSVTLTDAERAKIADAVNDDAAHRLQG